MTQLLFSLSVTAALLFFSQTAIAGSVTTTMDNQAIVVASCTMTATGVNFGTLSASGKTFANGSLAITCSMGTNYTVFLNAGSNADAAGLTRRLKRTGGPETIAYTLRKDSVSGALWGTGTTDRRICLTSLCSPLTSPKLLGKSEKGTGTQQTLTLFGFTAGGTTVPGIYRDTVKVVVVF